MNDSETCSIHVTELKSNWTHSDCIARPLELVREVFLTQQSYDGDWGVPAMFNRVLQNSWQEICSLNDVYSPSGELLSLPGPAHNSLVRFRGMVQDTLDTEYFMGVYEDVLPESGQKLLRTGKYTDIVEASEAMNPESAITFQRLIINCVAIPGETPWVRQHLETRLTHAEAVARSKRTRDDVLEDALEPREESKRNENNRQQETRSLGASSSSSNSSGSNSSGSSSSASTAVAWTEGPEGLQCLVKLYDEMEFRVGELVEFMGIFSSSPLLAESEDEQEYSSWASSRVMRLHAITCQRLPSGYPLLPELSFSVAPQTETILREYRTALPSVRSSLLQFITACLGGQQVFAEVFLLHLLSRIYQRSHGKPIGKLSLGLTLPLGAGSSRLVGVLSHLHSLLLPRAKVLTCNVSSLNAAPWYPVKDYARNRLLPGALQLAAGTGLLLDETTMESGKLFDVGVKNMRAVTCVLQEQVLQYDLLYHTLDFNTDVACVVVSRGKSILGACDVSMTVSDQNLPDNLPQPSEETLLAWRKFLLLARQLPFQLDDSTGMVSNAFVELRREDSRTNANSFHTLLTLARLLSVSHLDIELSGGRWNETLQLWRQVQNFR